MTALPREYPAAWAVDAVLSDGGTVHIRPIRPDDARAHRAFFSHQSAESVYRRFFSAKRELTDAEVEHFTTVDYHDRMAFVAFLQDEMIAIGRYDRVATSDRAEVAFAVADKHQGRGVGSLLLEYLASYAPEHGITRFSADTLTENRRMLDVFSAAGFRQEKHSMSGDVVGLTWDFEQGRMALVRGALRPESLSGQPSILCLAALGAGRDPREHVNQKHQMSGRQRTARDKGDRP